MARKESSERFQYICQRSCGYNKAILTNSITVI